MKLFQLVAIASLVAANAAAYASADSCVAPQWPQDAYFSVRSDNQEFKILAWPSNQVLGVVGLEGDAWTYRDGAGALVARSSGWQVTDCAGRVIGAIGAWLDGSDRVIAVKDASGAIALQGRRGPGTASIAFNNELGAEVARISHIDRWFTNDFSFNLSRPVDLRLVAAAFAEDFSDGAELSCPGRANTGDCCAGYYTQVCHYGRRGGGYCYPSYVCTAEYRCVFGQAACAQ